MIAARFFVLLALIATPFSANESLLAAPGGLADNTDQVAVFLVDLTADGQLDQIRLFADETLEVAVHATARSYTTMTSGIPATPATTLLTEDLNGDGHTDLYFISAQDNMAFIGDGTGMVTEATTSLGLSDRGIGTSAIRSDLDGDGFLDILLHNVGGDALFWGRADGTYERSAHTPETPAGSNEDVLGSLLGALGGTQGVQVIVTEEDSGSTSVSFGVPSLNGTSGTSGGQGASSAGNSGPPSPTIGTGGTVAAGSQLGGLTAGTTVRPSGSAPPLDIPPALTDALHAAFVDDNLGEVDSADVKDGSLTGKDVSTFSGPVTHEGITATDLAAVHAMGFAIDHGGYLGAEGTDNFDEVESFDRPGWEFGVVGISGDPVGEDNIGVIGHSTGVGVRGEHAENPDTNFAELGLSGVGLRASGTQLAGHFEGNVAINGASQGDGGTAALFVNGDVVIDDGDIDVVDGWVSIDFPNVFGLGTGLLVQTNDIDVTRTSVVLGLASQIIGDPDGGTPGAVFVYDINGDTSIVLDGLNEQITTPVLEITGGADLVEGFETFGPSAEPGMVVVIDPKHPGMLKTSVAAYDPKVAGVVSGAGGVDPGIRMGQKGTLDGETLVAMTGRIWVRCTAENGSIQPGDRLTTSSLEGHAMKATDSSRSDGAVIGKAMSVLDEGTGLVLVLVNLQ